MVELLTAGSTLSEGADADDGRAWGIAAVGRHSLYSLVEGASGFANRVDLGATQE